MDTRTKNLSHPLGYHLVWVHCPKSKKEIMKERKRGETFSNDLSIVPSSAIHPQISSKILLHCTVLVSKRQHKRASKNWWEPLNFFFFFFFLNFAKAGFGFAIYRYMNNNISCQNHVSNRSSSFKL